MSAILEAKNKGNDFFKRNNYVKAVEHYTAGLDSDGNHAVLRCNRAIAYLKLERPKEALEDCNIAANTDPKYVKAYFRRALAEMKLGDFWSAQEDLERTLQLDPENKEAITELRKLVQCKIPNGWFEIHPHQKPEGLRSQQLLKRIPITETWKQNSITVIANEASSQNIPENGQPTVESVKPDNCVKMDSSEDEIPTGIAGVTAATESEDNPSTVVPGAPSTSFQLLTDWRRFEHDPNSLSDYFMSIASQNYGTLFEEFLDGDILHIIVEILISHKDIAVSFEKLYQLTQIPRFSMATLFLEDQDKIRKFFRCSHGG